MYVKVIYDNKAKKGLASGRGFACLVDGKVLFDTGPDAQSLLDNMSRLMISIDDIKAVVISHDHWDHTGGLWEILRRRKGIKVFACGSFSDEFKIGVKELGGKLFFPQTLTEISTNVYVTGEIKGEYKGEVIGEQALVVKGQRGTSLITGCAHPGVLEMVLAARKTAHVRNVYMVFGGFHLDGIKRDEINSVVEELKKMKVAKVGPTHCAGDKARRVFRGKYHENYIPVKAGHIIQL